MDAIARQHRPAPFELMRKLLHLDCVDWCEAPLVAQAAEFIAATLMARNLL
jgi:hypothetical protein